MDVLLERDQLYKNVSNLLTQFWVESVSPGRTFLLY